MGIHYFGAEHFANADQAYRWNALVNEVQSRTNSRFADVSVTRDVQTKNILLTITNPAGTEAYVKASLKPSTGLLTVSVFKDGRSLAVSTFEDWSGNITLYPTAAYIASCGER